MTFIAIPFADENRREWAEFVDRCPEAWLDHRPEFLGLGGGDCSFAVRRDGQLVGVCALARCRVAWGAVLQGAGPALAPDIAPGEIAAFLGDELRRRARAHHALAVQIELPALAPGVSGARFNDTALARLGFAADLRWGGGFARVPGFHSIIDLRQDLGAILKGFTKGNRASVQRCRKLDFTIAVAAGESLSDADWDGFIALHRATFARTGATPFSDARLDQLAGLVRARLLTLVTVRDNNGESAASLLLATYKGRVAYHAGGCSEPAQRLGIMAFAHAGGMEWAQQNGFSHYSMGASFPALKGTKMGNIGDFKRRFGGGHWDLVCGELVTDRLGYGARVLLPTGLRKLAHDHMPEAAANVLRRLRGRARGGIAMEKPLSPA